jgi:hypothetical protein
LSWRRGAAAVAAAATDQSERHHQQQNPKQDELPAIAFASVSGEYQTEEA